MTLGFHPKSFLAFVESPISKSTSAGLKNCGLIVNTGLFDYYVLGPYDLTADLGCVADWENKKYLELIDKFNKEIPIEKRGVHIVSNISNEYKNKFKNYGFVAFGMDTTIIKSGINNFKSLWK